MKKISIFCFLICSVALLTGCDIFGGKKNDAVVQDVLKQGAIDPNLNLQVGYVPIQPDWKGFDQPTDVFVGYDQMVYVTDSKGLHVLDQKGQEFRLIPIEGASHVTQDRRLITYVIGRTTRRVNDITYSLAAVYRIKNASTAEPAAVLDTLVHPFCDLSRQNTNFRQTTDPQVTFTGITTLADNTVYLSRSGSVNSLTSAVNPDNAVLIFDANGRNAGAANGLNPVFSSLRSAISPSGICSFVAPPQLQFGTSTSADFILLQNAPNAEYKVLWIKQAVDPDQGPIYSENSDLLDFDTTKAKRFLYDPFRFTSPKDVCIAPDGTSYIFVLDQDRDSVYIFNNKGFEGVNPAPNSGSTRLVNASFGGKGAGPYQFSSPSGIAYFQRTLYVADKGNNRIVRYRLSTDLQR